MALGTRQAERQTEFWIPTGELASAPGHPFYRKLNAVLAERGFDRFVEEQCRRFYAENVGRPGIPPGVYFRMLLIGFFEGIDSERGIAWRCADSLGLRGFLGYSLTESTPDHSSLSVIRKRIDVVTHVAVFGWVLTVLDADGLLRGTTLGVDATTLEANAAMRSIVRRDTGESYEAFLTQLAQGGGIETPTRSDLAKVDRKRKKKGSNTDWHNPHDSDARITKMKDGRTHLAHKAEHTVDMDSGAVVSVRLAGADQGDTQTLGDSLEDAEQNLAAVRDDDAPSEDDAADAKGTASSSGESAKPIVRNVVADKGYHSNDTCRDCKRARYRTYLSEPDRGRRRWAGKSEEQRAVYANRRRIRGDRGKALLRKRGELLERSFAHCYETGAMRRTHLREHPNILKRLLIHVAGFNLALVMRTRYGIGKPRVLQGMLLAGILELRLAWSFAWRGLWARVRRLGRRQATSGARVVASRAA
jgi:transposase